MIQGRKKWRGIKIDFVEALLQNTEDFKLLLGHQIKEYGSTLLSCEIIRGDRIGV